MKPQTHKVGVIIFRWQSAEDENRTLQFLIHLPKPKRAGEEDRMQWGLARGTVRYRVSPDKPWVDARASEQFEYAITHDYEFESLEDTWWMEAGEELGVQLESKPPLIDLGLHEYVSLNHPPYPIHFLALEWPQDGHLETPQDALAVAFKSLDDVRAMASGESAIANERMKPGYVTILEAVEQQLHRFKKS